MSDWLDEETVLSDFRDWLSGLRLEADQLSADQVDADVDVDVEVAPPVGLYRLVEEFTALRQDVKLQAKSARNLLEQNGNLATALQEAVQRLATIKPHEAQAARAAAKPLVEALADLDEALERGRMETERAHVRLLETLADGPGVDGPVADEPLADRPLADKLGDDELRNDEPSDDEPSDALTGSAESRRDSNGEFDDFERDAAGDAATDFGSAAMIEAIDQAFSALPSWKRWAASDFQRQVVEIIRNERRSSDYEPTSNESRQVADARQAGLLAARNREMARRILDSILDGYRLIQNRLTKVMQRERLVRLDCAGQPVDPQTMTVIEVVDDRARRPGTVLEEVRRGYLWQDQVLRYAEVRAVKERASAHDLGQRDGSRADVE